MLKLKSVVKTREQLLATGWMERLHGSFEHPSVIVRVNPSICKGICNGIVNKEIKTKLIGSKDPDECWYITPEMMLVTDQWGFVRDPETLDILMWDAARSPNSLVLKDILNSVRTYNIELSDDKSRKLDYTQMGEYHDFRPATLSKYPYSLTHGGYTPFDFKELVEAFNCPKVLEGSDDTSTAPSDIGNSTKPDSYRSTVAPKGYGDAEVTDEAKMKDEAKPPVTLGDQEMYRFHFVSTTIRQLTESMRYLDGDVKKMVEQKIAELLKSI